MTGATFCIRVFVLVLLSQTVSLCACESIVKMAENTSIRGKSGLVANGPEFTLDGKPLRIFSGAMHYFRVPHEYWEDRLLKMKACGLNTVETYVAWNLHEETQGNFNFQGTLDLLLFLQTAQQVGLHVIFRPGPFICAEWEWGGHPAWLLKDPNMKVRTLYPGYVQAVEAYFAKLLPLIIQYQYQNGGPIIAVQVENEYGAYGNDTAYLGWLKDLLIRNGIKELLFTSDGPPWLKAGTLPGLYTVVNFGGNFGGQNGSAESLNALKKFQPNRPLMVGEFWSGWFDHWGEQHHVWNPDSFKQQLEIVLRMNSSLNFYMFHGGTNFGFMNGANRFYHAGSPIYAATVTSYDYDCPLSESGWVTEKYLIIRELMRQYNPDFPNDPSLDDLVESSKLQNQGPSGSSVHLPQMYLNFTDMLTMVQPRQAQALQTMERYGQHYGFIAYRASLDPAGGTLAFSVVVADRLQVILNGKTVQTIEHQGSTEGTVSDFVIQAPSSINGKSLDLILLVENTGRVNYEQFPHNLDGERKGLTGVIYFNGDRLVTWNVYNLDFNSAFMKTLSENGKWNLRVSQGLQRQSQPVFYKSVVPLSAGQMKDYFVDCKAWSKGVVFVNNFNLGRYWEIGPQKTLYLPKTLLQAQNTLIMLELEAAGDALAILDYPDLGPPCEMPCYPWLDSTVGLG